MTSIVNLTEAYRYLLAQVLSGLVHKRIICLLGACTSPPHLAIVEELAEKSLHAELHRQGDGSERAEPAPMPYARVGSSQAPSSLFDGCTC